jgi:hypothetical protein
MRTTVCVLLAAVAASLDPEPGIAYFTRVRDVTTAAPSQQNYFIVDADVWSYARPDLADLRLYSGDDQVPYALVEAHGGALHVESKVKVLNAARHGDHTEFDLDMAGVTEYNRITLGISAKNFVASAYATAGDAPGAKAAGAAWPAPSTLFDLSRENLGDNLTIAVPAWTFRYVHVRLTPGITPEEVRGATVALLQERDAQWTDAGSCGVPERRGRTTVITCTVPLRSPIDRVIFTVPLPQANFRRAVSVGIDSGARLGGGSITRVRITRGGQTAISEHLAVSAANDSLGRFTVMIDNGDDQPLVIAHAQPQVLQRRLYFEPPARAGLKFYYGDAALMAPRYDYANFFHEDPGAALAALGPPAANAAYTGRGDDRPWSERHPAVLWIAMFVAVAGIGAMALSGLRRAEQPRS